MKSTTTSSIVKKQSSKKYSRLEKFKIEDIRRLKFD
jgi:hypothetical protein